MTQIVELPGNGYREMADRLPDVGYRIERRTVENLLNLMGEKIDFLVGEDERGWTTRSVDGECKIVPEESGLDFDLYVRRAAIYTGPKPFILQMWTIGEMGDPNWLEREHYEIIRFHKRVPYEK